MSSIVRKRFKRKVKDMDTRQSNKLIAEFMGGEEVFEGDPSSGGGWIWLGVEEIPVAMIPVITSNLAYHDSWDWLMPVVEKIEKTLDRSTVVTIRSKTVSIAEGSQEFNRTFYGNTRLKAAWKGCVRFIKWYNKQQNNNPLDHTPTPEESPYLYKRKENYV